MARGPNGTDHLNDLRRAAQREARGWEGRLPPGIAEWAADEIERLRGEVEDLRTALEAAQIPQVRVDPPHPLRGPHG